MAAPRVDAAQALSAVRENIELCGPLSLLRGARATQQMISYNARSETFPASKTVNRTAADTPLSLITPSKQLPANGLGAAMLRPAGGAALLM
jgi:hypothetical protein